MSRSITERFIPTKHESYSYNETTTSYAANITYQNDNMKNLSWVFAQVVVIVLIIAYIGILKSLLTSTEKRIKRKSAIDKIQYMLALGACISGVVCVTSTQVVIILTLVKFDLVVLKMHCFGIKIFKHLFLFLASLFTSSFLWWRLYALYQKPVMKRLTNKYFKGISILAGILLLGANCIFALLLFTVTWKSNQNRTCSSDKKHLKHVSSYLQNTFLSLRVISSALMVGLLIYPLIVYHKSKSNANNRTRGSSTTIIIMRKVKLAAISVTICILADIIINSIQRYVKILFNCSTIKNLMILCIFKLVT